MTLMPNRHDEDAIRLRAAFEHAPMCVAVLTPDGRILNINPAGCALFTRDVTALVGSSFDDLVHVDDRRLFLDVVSGRVNRNRRFELRLTRPDGVMLWALTAATVVPGPAGTTDHTIVMLVDITDRREAEHLLAHSATHDPLTGLLNRSAFTLALDRAVARRSDPGSTALLFCDLDGFKKVNDTLGHAAGDIVLTEVARRLGFTTRESDSIARFGGDEFVLLCEDLTSPENAVTIAERIVAAIEEPFDVNGRAVHIGVSVGVAISDGAISSDALLRSSDAAVYRAKERGRSRIEVFDDTLRAAHDARRTLEVALREAIDGAAIDVGLQPIVRLDDRRLHAHRAMVSWAGPGMPAFDDTALVALAAESGLAPLLDRHVLAALGKRHLAWAADSRVHVALAPSHLNDRSLIPGICDALSHSGFDPGQVTLEVPEQWMLESIGRVEQITTALHAIGVRVGITGFGRHAEALALLDRLSIDVVTIAHALHAGLGARAHGRCVVRGVVEYAHAAGCLVIADDVRHSDALALVTDLGCDLARGIGVAPRADAALRSATVSGS